MTEGLCSKIRQNKNLLMLITVGIYIFAVISVLNSQTVLVSAIYTSILVLCAIKQIFPIKHIFIWTLIFYFGIINTSARLQNVDELLSIAPVNSEIYGKIISIPQQKDNGKYRFFFKVDRIDYDGITKHFKNEKALVSLDDSNNLKIYNSYKIRGRLSVPFKAGNPSQFDYSDYLRNFSTYAVFYGKNPYSMRNIDKPCYEEIPTKKSLLEKGLQKINDYREKVINIHSNYMQSPNLEILGGIVFGDDAVNPPQNIKQSFINSGLLHILAASGMNVGFIATFFFLILKFFKLNFKLNTIICILAVLTYMLMTGLGASVLRAGIMLIFVLAGKLINRDANNISLLSFVAFLMLLINPMYLNDVGFQLSFVVTFGLLLTIPYLFKSKYKIINWCIGTVMIPIIAQLWVIPIQIFYFNNISIYSVFANIMSVPILSIISFGGFISSVLAVIAPISHIICKLFDMILNPLITILVNISDFWGNLPNSTYHTTHPNPVQILIYYAIITIITQLFNKDFFKIYSRKAIFVCITLLTLLLISLIPIRNHDVEIMAFDVGNADSFLIKTPNNEYTLIDTAKSGYDGGKSQAEMIILKYFKDRGIKTVDNIIVTHFDNDHCGGATDLINNIIVKNIYINSINHNSAAAKSIIQAAKSRNVNIIEAKNNQTVYNKDGLELSNYISDNSKDVSDNETSIITLLEYKEFSMLFMGDAGIKTFEEIKTNLPQNITVLKVGHHGAIGVVNKSLLNYLKPKYSIISTGENKFGHPSPYTIQALKNAHVKILRTDNNNAIKFKINNKGYEVYSYVSDSKKWRKLK